VSVSSCSDDGRLFQALGPAQENELQTHPLPFAVFEKSNEVESRYLQEKVTLLQVESSLYLEKYQKNLL